MNKLYSVHDHWTDINKKNDVDIESIDGVITGIKVNGEDYGGGGSSDFSTAEVKLINGGSSMGRGLRLCVVDDVNNSTATTARLIDGTSKTFNAILYNGEAYASLYDSTSVVSYEGNIEPAGKNGYIITGDCTITIS